MRLGLAITLLIVGSTAHIAIAQGPSRGCCDAYQSVVSPAPGDGAAVSGNVNDACSTCHEMPAMGHPVDLASTAVEIPEDFPPGSGGLKCTTCHTPCGEVEAANPSMLRGPLRDERFCTNCHGSWPVPLDQNHHGLAGLAHPRSTVASAPDTGLLDDVTIGCLDCHLVGGFAPEVEFPTGGGLAIGHSHSLGASYARSSFGKRSLRDIESVPAAVVLREGKVGCLSCHNLYTGGRGRLSVDNTRSRLCLTCHDV